MMNAHWIPWTDRVIFIAANLINLLVAVMFLLRVRGRHKAGRAYGWAAVADARFAPRVGGGHGDAHLSEPYWG